MVAVAATPEQLARLRLPGHFSLQARVGAGAMGEVFRGAADTDGQQLAIKFVRSELCSDPVFVARFVREARALDMLRSPHIPRVVEFGVAMPNGGCLALDAEATARLSPDPVPGLVQPGNFLFLTMQWAHGRTLTELIGKGNGLNGPQLAQLAIGLLDALGEAHAHNLVHRDIKHANVVVGERHGQLHPWLIDFGVVKSVQGDLGDELTQGFVAGTPHYFSPEQARGEPVTANADLWALGALAFYCLTVRYPFEAGNVAKMIVSIQRGAPTALTPALCKHPVSNQLVAWVNHLLQPDLSQRLSTVEAARSELLGCAEAVDLEAGAATATLPPAGRSPSGSIHSILRAGVPAMPPSIDADVATQAMPAQPLPDADATLALPAQVRPTDATLALQAQSRVPNTGDAPTVAMPIVANRLRWTWAVAGVVVAALAAWLALGR